MRIFFIVGCAVMFLFNALYANEIYQFIPANSQQVLQVNLNAVAGMETIQQDLVRNINRQTGLDPKNEKLQNFGSLVERLVAVTPDLMVDETFIFVKIKIPEAEFCRKIEELTGSKLVPLPGTKPVERRFTLEGNQVFPGVALKKRTFAVMFLSGNVAVFAKNDLSNYRKINKGPGISEQLRKELNPPKALAAGFVVFTADFLAENPYLPQIRRARYALSAEKDGSLRIKASAVCPDKKMAKQTLAQVQQFVMVGGMMLNQLDPELMQEWITSVRVGRDKNEVAVNAFFTRDFINRLAAASEKLTAEPQARPEPAGEGKKR